MPPGDVGGCGGSMPKRGQEMVCNRVSHRCLLRRLRQERSRGHQMVPREPSDIARIGMLGAKRELLRTVHRWGGKRPRAIEGHSRVTIQTYHVFKRLASLALPKDARA